MLILSAWMALGLTCLVLGAEWFVRGAAKLAVAFGVPPLVIGLTVVAYGTSMPELVVSAVAALEGRSAIALGNVVGSNIANIGLILGITALISPPKVDGSLVRREVPWLLGSALLLPVLLFDGAIGRIDAAFLLAGAIAFTIFTVRTTREASGDQGIAASEGEAAARRGLPLAIGFTLVGLALLLLGGRWFVAAATDLAVRFGISERVIGLTIVAVGTSLPELAASVVAAVRGFSSLAIGNVIGSNIFNVVFVLGGAGVIAPVQGELSALRVDLGLMIGFTLFAAALLRGQRRIARWEGAVLVAAYVGAMYYVSSGGS
jgi:cation:H+ antiporter